MEKWSIHKKIWLFQKNPSWTKELHCRYFTTATLLWSSINPYKLWGCLSCLSPLGLLVVSDHSHGVHLREGKDHGGIHLARGRKTNHRVEISSRIGNKNFFYPSHKSQPLQIIAHRRTRASSTRTSASCDVSLLHLEIQHFNLAWHSQPKKFRQKAPHSAHKLPMRSYMRKK